MNCASRWRYHVTLSGTLEIIVTELHGLNRVSLLTCQCGLFFQPACSLGRYLGHIFAAAVLIDIFCRRIVPPILCVVEVLQLAPAKGVLDG